MVDLPVVGLILAGGRATRLGGGDKSLIDMAGRPMLAHVIERLALQVDAIAISANGDPTRFAAFGLPVLEDVIDGYAGPLAGILAGMRWAQSATPEASFIASAAADTPFFPTDLVAQLSAARGDDEQPIALAASSGGTHPTFALWPVALASDLAAFLNKGGRKVLDFVEGHPWVSASFADIALPDGEALDPFFNVNTPEDVARAAQIAAALN